MTSIMAKLFRKFDSIFAKLGKIFCGRSISFSTWHLSASLGGMQDDDGQRWGRRSIFGLAISTHLTQWLI